MAIIREFLTTRSDGVNFYLLKSDDDTKCILQEETGIYYSSVAITDDDTYTYVEAKDPNYVPSEENQEEPQVLKQMEISDSDKENYEFAKSVLESYNDAQITKAVHVIEEYNKKYASIL